MAKPRRFDYILGKQSDKPIVENVFFVSFTADITKAELFGSKRLDAFFQIESKTSCFLLRNVLCAQEP